MEILLGILILQQIGALGQTFPSPAAAQTPYRSILMVIGLVVEYCQT
jgi:hypothetical protein